MVSRGPRQNRWRRLRLAPANTTNARIRQDAPTIHPVNVHRIRLQGTRSRFGNNRRSFRMGQKKQVPSDPIACRRDGTRSLCETGIRERMGNETAPFEASLFSTQSHSEIRDPLFEGHSIMSRPVPRCSCGGELAIAGEIRNDEGWRTGFKLQCKKCSKRWTYSGGIYHADMTTG